MTNRLLIRQEAEADLGDARDWYESHKSGLGNEFLESVNQALNQIRSFPKLAPAEYRSVRRVRLRRFPYIVYYRVLEAFIEVIAVLHGSRDPRLFHERTDP